MFYSLPSILLVLGLFPASYQLTKDYCEADYCEPGLKNVGCNPPPKEGGPACRGKQTINANLTIVGQTFILHEHNRLRSQLASGQLGSFAPAARMPLLVWDSELADQAAHNARSCLFDHDECRNTEQFRFVGQNIAIYQYMGPRKSLKELMGKEILQWWSEHNVTTQQHLDKFPSEEPEPEIGHFTQMVSDRTWKIGCSAQQWIGSEEEYNEFYFVCNYSFTNMIGQPVYVKGKPASRCVSGENKLYPGLCSIHERIYSTPTAIAN
ncbi:antigen 5 like allergen Cul n 1-like [Anopheles maculipalpis]|uniref:antigen 5 like allergen Cul n 1-like n=1 Tax=Anopheles maculipalpis TaxID=1496333 RepID=UPI002158D3A7|nr:antigen 5 like allergen Cul n 1-like [Anopheles maculipalpis]